MTHPTQPTDTSTVGWWWPALGVWLLAFALMLALDSQLDLAGEALLLVLASAVAALWTPRWVSLLASAAGVQAFNVAFVPPRGSFTVDLRQHALLLGTMLAVSWIVSLLMSRQRQLAAAERQQALQADQLRQLGDALRAVDDPRTQGPLLQAALARVTHQACSLLLLAQPAGVADGEAQTLGPLNGDQQAGLWHCARHGQALGPGTGRHDEQAAWYLPLRGRARVHGAALLPLPPGGPPNDAQRAQAQSLCDQMGAALEQAAALRAAGSAREAAQAQALRNTLLAAIAHDHRTPLATILGAASSLHDQAERLSIEQRRRLAATIVDEATQLARLTDNSLQLARLDAPGLTLALDWESVEELIGSVLRRVRQRDPAHRIKARVDAGLPLLRCDAVLMVQLLDNLVDNALHHGGHDSPVEVVARRVGDQVLLAVADRGPGVPPALRSRIFETFQRGPAAVAAAGAADDHPVRRGAGIGLALCRAIAHAHGGELRLRARRQGGSSFELLLPIPPDAPAADLPEAAP